MSPSAFFVFMQIDSLLLGKVYSVLLSILLSAWSYQLAGKAALCKNEEAIGNVGN